jgi:hypothetical protein
VTCGPDCVCSGGHCCPPCTVWFDGASGPNWGLFGAIAGGVIEGALGALTLGLIGTLIHEKLRPGCYPCSKMNKDGVRLACCDLENCTNLKTDPENCGKCGGNCGIWSCQPGEFGPICLTSNRICEKGHCVCPPGLPDLCTGQCTNLATGMPFCGTCGNTCFPGQICCDGFCTDPQTDVFNCGSCGNSCLAPIWGFVEGGGHTCCNGKCVDPLQDVKNCGVCGLICAAGQICSSGVCFTPVPIQ